MPAVSATASTPVRRNGGGGGSGYGMPSSAMTSTATVAARPPGALKRGHYSCQPDTPNRIRTSNPAPKQRRSAGAAAGMGRGGGSSSMNAAVGGAAGAAAPAMQPPMTQPLPADHYPATVYRYTRLRGWERYRASTPRAAAARAATRAAGAPNGPGVASSTMGRCPSAPYPRGDASRSAPFGFASVCSVPPPPLPMLPRRRRRRRERRRQCCHRRR